MSNSSAEADRAATMARLAMTCLKQGEPERALQLCENALALAPDNGEVWVLTAEVLSRNVPPWYFAIVSDEIRHGLYEKVFRRNIRQGDLVLDIGSGTGLFAMMTARAGAKVVSCERNVIVADAVARIIAHNGLSGRVKIVAKFSSDLLEGVDYERAFDVVVWDNLANNLIGAGALPAIEQAVRRLARPGARVIPARGRIRVALAERVSPYAPTPEIEGFDMAAFDRRSPPRTLMSPKQERFIVRSKPADLFVFEFRSGGPFPGAHASVTLETDGGRVDGIAQWVVLELDEETSDENWPPTTRRRGLIGVFHHLAAPRDLRAGESLVIHASHDRETLRIWADIPS